MMVPMVSLENVAKTYRGPDKKITAADGISFSVEVGKIVTLSGPSGSGKTTILLCAGGLMAPDGGTVKVDAVDLYKADNGTRDRFRGEKIGFVFQQFHLLPYLTVGENILVPLLARTAKAKFYHTKLLERFGLVERKDHLPKALSTGERQRAALARALCNDPVFLCADEPTGNLDDRNAEIVLKDLRRFADEGGAVLLATHDRRALSFADRTIKINSGRIEQEGR